ncbi:MAG: UDP-3-O-(3-hydroxymyristoyl)glucosamine N-acyltransferase [Ignavibacteria bacterium]|nr:UDP-3-O-(3-hydroxymyristoyl)glucosamine N-acyltransferase [Ignavibacteria bacterium]
MIVQSSNNAAHPPKPPAKALTTQELSTMLGVALEGKTEALISSVNTLEDAERGDLTFLANPKYAGFVAATNASAILVKTDFIVSAEYKGAILRTDDPYNAFLRAVEYFCPLPVLEVGVRHSSSVIAGSAEIHASAHIGANVVIGERCRIGAEAVLRAGVILYDDVQIGEQTILHGNVVCYDRTVIGSRCVIHAGTVIGSDGFGFAENKNDGSFTKIPQVGNVVIGDDVEIGANCTIDRASLRSTRLENGVKLDNLIHIAHNVVIGENTAIAAQTGISGSTKLGKRNRIAGQVGFVGHISTADDVIVYAQSGVAKGIAQKGVYFGAPAKPLMDELRLQAVLKQLPDLIRHSSQ